MVRKINGGCRHAGTWAKVKKKAQDLADAYAKPVSIYRRIENNRSAGFVYGVQGQGDRPGVFLETMKPTPKARITVTTADGVLIEAFDTTDMDLTMPLAKADLMNSLLSAVNRANAYKP